MDGWSEAALDSEDSEPFALTATTRLEAERTRLLVDYFGYILKQVNSPLILNTIMRVPAKPNLIYRSILAHIIAANDSGIPTAFDAEGQRIFFRRQDLRSGSWSLFYWIYTGPSIFLMRNAYYTIWHPLEIFPLQILKCYPLAFMFAQRPRFGGLPNLLRFVRSRDDEEVDLPILTYARENLDTWPAIPIDNTSMLLAGDSFGFVGSKG